MRGLFILSFSLLGCVGDSSTPIDAGPDADLTGTKGHPCFPNNTCIGTLTCQLPAGICVDLGSDAGMDATMMDSPTESGGMDSGGDAGFTCAPPTPVDLVQSCYSLGKATCVDCAGGTIACASSCNAADSYLKCGSSHTVCGSGMACCLDPQTTTTLGCPIVATYPASLCNATSPSTGCQNTCPSNSLQLCYDDTDCKVNAGNPHCTNATLNIGSFKTGVGICGP